MWRRVLLTKTELAALALPYLECVGTGEPAAFSVDKELSTTSVRLVRWLRRYHFKASINIQATA